MTKRSDRIAAERAVIEAAVALVDNPPDLGWHRHSVTGSALQETVAHLRQQELEQPDEGRIAHDTTSTSIEAGQSIRPVTGKVARRCWEEIALTGRAGLTADQVDIALKLGHQTISARVNELRDKGWIADSGKKRKTRKGRNAIVWVATEQSTFQAWLS